MNLESLQPNVQELKEDVSQLLGQVSDLMGRASIALGADTVGIEYEEFRQQVNKEAHKVDNLELVMAIVAPMKAGKSTIINAVAGQELLPSRSTAMTTLPTEIFFSTEIHEPTLTLSPELIKIFQKTFTILQEKITKIGIEAARKNLSQYPHLMPLLDKISVGIWGSLTRTETVGRTEIINTLAELNDVIRLCSVIEPSINPLRGLIEDVPEIKTRPSLLLKIDQSPNIGNLIIIDTPGPNEAGENNQLATVVNEQLKNSSIVLIVLDYTQLKTKASEEVKQDVQKIIALRGKENLYVLVNKVDQRGENDMDCEQVRQFVAAELGIGDSDDTDRVFEIAARWAFCASNFLWELKQHPGINITQMKTAPALAQQALGAMWKTKLSKVSVEKLQLEAKDIWEASGFPAFLEKAIKALMGQVAPRSMKSALTFSKRLLVKLCEDVEFRKSAIIKEADVLKSQIEALEEDLHHLDLCQNRLQQVDKIKAELQKELNNLFNKLSRREVPERLLREFNDQSQIRFDSRSSAENFQDGIERSIRQEVDNLLDNAREETKKLTAKAHEDLTLYLERETAPIIQRAKTRLNETFNINLSFKPPNITSDDIGVVKSRRANIQTKTESWTEWEIKKERRFYTLFLWEHKKKVPVNKSAQYYLVSKQEMTVLFKESIENNVQATRPKINQYVEGDFQEHIKAFFDNLDAYLSSYRDNLKQAQKDSKLSSEEKNKLMATLDLLVPEAESQIDKVDTYLKRTNSLMPDSISND